MAGRFFTVMAVVGTAAVVVLGTVWLVGQTFRDWVWLTALCFYFPSPLAAVLLIVMAGLAAWRKRWRMTAATALLAIGPLAFVLFVENQWLPPPTPPETGTRLRLVHWNVAEGFLGWGGVIETLKGLGADACVLSEAEDDVALTDVAAALGDGFVIERRGDLALVARGRLTLTGEGKFDQARWYTADWEIGGVRLKVMAADMPSDLIVDRAPLLTALVGVIAEAKPDVVAGDFNAPRRSWALSQLSAGYTHAYDRVGSGWSYSWPVPCPILAIDQCLIGPRVQPLHYEQRSTTVSDHRLQVLDFILAD